MPRKTETYDLQAEAQRLDERAAELDEQLAELDADDTVADDAPEVRQTMAEGLKVDKMIAGVHWALDPPDDETVLDGPVDEVTLGALTAGEAAMAGDVSAGALEEIREQTALDVGNGGNMSNLHKVAAGLVDAPWISQQDNVQETMQKTSQVAPQFQTWLYERVDELTTPEVEGNGFIARVRARRSTGEQK